MKPTILFHGSMIVLVALSMRWLLGCSPGSDPTDANTLRRRFPDQADEVLRARFAFAAAGGGFEPVPSSGERSLGSDGRVRAWLPGSGDGALRLDLPGGSQVQVHEVGASGRGVIAENAVAYARESGASFWAATESGYEEWVWVEAQAVHRDAPVAAWGVTGAALRQRGEAVDVVDETGTARARVTAPAAYAAGGRPIATRLAVHGSQVEVWADAEGEAVLVDPGWIGLRQGMSTARQYHTATKLNDGRVLVAGGFDGVQVFGSAEIYDPVSRTWETHEMSTPRALHTATLLLDGTVLVTGGTNFVLGIGPPPPAVSKMLNTAELFDPGTGSWRPVASMSFHRERHTATRLNDGRVLVAGGWGGDIHTEMFTPPTTANDSGSWEEGPVMNGNRAGHTATLLPEGVLVTGGVDVVQVLNTAELFDFKQWITLQSMASERAYHTATLLNDGRVLIAGDGGNAGATTEIFTPPSGGPGSESWAPGPTMRVDRYTLTATSLPDGRVLVAGGDTSGTHGTSEVFDPANPTTWTLYMNMIENRVAHAATLLDDGSVLVVGGTSGATGFEERFDPTSPTWVQIDAMSSPRTGHSATLLGAQVLVAGGFDGQTCNGTLDSAEILTPDGGWTPAGHMSTARAYHAATLQQGQVLVTGGFGTFDDFCFTSPSSSTDLFNASTGWRMGPPLNDQYAFHTATALPDGTTLVVDGTNVAITPGPMPPEMDYPTPQGVVDLLGNTMSISGMMNIPRENHAAVDLSDGRVLVMGGLLSPNSVITSTELFSSGAWEVVNDLLTPRAFHTATRLDGDGVLVTGGFDGMGDATNSVELFDPRFKAWTSSASLSMLNGRMGHTATLLPNGWVVVAGGFNGPTGTALDSVELINPAAPAASWSATASMHFARGYHTATLLQDGHVLVTGGQDQTGVPTIEFVAGEVLASAEVLNLQPLGTGCYRAADCQSGFCAAGDGVCCDHACTGACAACSEARGATTDGACTPIPGCHCRSIDDCAPGLACDETGACVPSPPDSGYRDDGGCVCSFPRDRTRGAAGIAVGALAALSALRRRRSRGSGAIARRAGLG